MLFIFFILIFLSFFAAFPTTLLIHGFKIHPLRASNTKNFRRCYHRHADSFASILVLLVSICFCGSSCSLLHSHHHSASDRRSYSPSLFGLISVYVLIGSHYLCVTTCTKRVASVQCCHCKEHGIIDNCMKNHWSSNKLRVNWKQKKIQIRFKRRANTSIWETGK